VYIPSSAASCTDRVGVQPVHGRFGREVQPFIGKLRNQLLRRQAGVARTGQHGDYLRFLGRGQRITWPVLRSTAPVPDFGIRTPAPDGPSRDPEQVTRRRQTRACGLRFGDEIDNHFSFCPFVSSSSSSP